MNIKDTSDGQTHSFNDGCGEPEHNRTDEAVEKCDKITCAKPFCPKDFHSPDTTEEKHDGLETRGLTTNEEAIAIVRQMQRNSVLAASPDTRVEGKTRDRDVNDENDDWSVRLGDFCEKNRIEDELSGLIYDFVESEMRKRIAEEDTKVAEVLCGLNVAIAAVREAWKVANEKK